MKEEEILNNQSMAYLMKGATAPTTEEAGKYYGTSDSIEKDLKDLRKEIKDVKKAAGL